MKTAFICCLFILGFTFGTRSQNYLSGTTALSFTDPARSNRQVTADIAYPANTTGAGVAVATGTMAFPVVVFGHGFSLSASSYKRLTDSLVSYGYVVVLPTTETGLSPSHENFGKDIAFLADAVTALGNNSSSLFYQRVTNKAAVAGHSMGGGCSFLAAATGRTSITALFNFAAAETNPSATAAASNVAVPTLVFSGSSDCIVPPATQLSMYNNLPVACKTYVNITGGTHCQIANNNGTCTFGQITSGCNSSSINVDTFLNKSLSLLLPFLDYHLKLECQRGIAFVNLYNQITGVSNKFSNCIPPVCIPLAVTFLQLSGRLINNIVELQWDTENEYRVENYLVERSINGNDFSELASTPAIGSSNNHYTQTDPLPFPNSTYYRIKAINSDGEFKYSNVINIRTPEKSVYVSAAYPNPVIDKLQVKIYSIAESTLQLQLIAADGKLLKTEAMNVVRGMTSKEVDMKVLATGSYLLLLRQSDGTIIYKNRLLKKN